MPQKNFTSKCLILLIVFLLTAPSFASDKISTNSNEELALKVKAQRFENLNSTDINIYYNNNLLNKEKILQFFLNASPLIKTDFYPTNFKLKVYKYIDGKQIILKVLNKNIKVAKSAEKSIFLTDLNLVNDQENIYIDLYDSNDNIYGSYKITVNFENQTQTIVNNTENTDCNLDEPDCLLKFIFEKVNFSASFDNKLITEVSRLESGNYSVIIPVKKGNKLTNKVKDFNFTSDNGGKTNSKGNSNSGYYPYFNSTKDEVAFSTWNEDDSSISFSTASLDDVLQIYSNNTIAIRSSNKQGLLNIGASSEGKPNIVFEPGSLSTALIDGALEYDGSQLYFTSNGSRIALGSGSGVGIPGPAGPIGPQGPVGPAGLDGSSNGTLGAIQFSDGVGGFSSNASNLFWDDVNGYALIGDVSLDEIALGHKAAASNSGNHVNALGNFAANSNTGSDINSFGHYAAQSNNGSMLNAFGFAAGMNNIGYSVNAIGFSAAWQNTGSTLNAIGYNAAAWNRGDITNAIGFGAAQYNSGNNVNAIGHGAAHYNNGDNIDALGQQTLYNNNGDYNIALGYRAGYNTRNGSENIMIGRGADIADPNLNKQINIGNTIYGGNGRLAIGIVKPLAAATLELNGSFLYRDGNQALGRVLTSDALGNATWQAAPSGGDTNGQVFVVNNNVISNNGSSADYQDDFVIGSPSLDYSSNISHSSRMFFDKSKGAFRVGKDGTGNWDSTNLGNYSFAFGNGSIASGLGSFAGGAAIANGDYSLALGNDPRVITENYGLSIGNVNGPHSSNIISANGGIAMGSTGFPVGFLDEGQIITSGGISIGTALGNAQILSSGSSIALGAAFASDIIAIGTGAAARGVSNATAPNSLKAQGEGATVIGRAQGSSIFANGVAAYASGHSLGIGVNGIYAEGIAARAIGYSDLSAKGEVAYSHGAYVTANGDYSFVFGHGNDYNDHLVSDQGNSLSVGFNSNAATLFVGPSAGGSTTGNVGIGTSTPAAKLDIIGGIKITDGTQALGRVLTSDALGNATWQAAPSGGDTNGQVFVVNNNVISNNGSSADYQDDFVIGSPSLADTGIAANDSRMFFDKSKGAFRAGSVNSSQWNDANIGNYSVAFGTGNIASGSSSIAWGTDNTAGTDYSTVWGENNTVSGDYSTSWGSNNITAGDHTTTWGTANLANNIYATAWGQNNIASGETTTVFGRYVEAAGNYSIAFGSGNSGVDRLVNNTNQSLKIGFNSNAATLFVGPSAGGSTTGYVGIGTSTPARKLHISEAMRLEPQASPPASPSTGDLYVDSDGLQALCIYLNGAWVVAAGSGTCS